VPVATVLAMLGWLFGAIAAFLGMRVALRASLLYRKSWDARDSAAAVSGSEVSGLLDKLAGNLEEHARWRPIDHQRLLHSIYALILSYGFSAASLIARLLG